MVRFRRLEGWGDSRLRNWCAVAWGTSLGRMPRVVWGTIATAGPMGQQRYESEIQTAIAREAQGWSFDARRVTSLRSGLAGARRIPARLNGGASLAVSAILGRYVYGSADLYHRFDLRLPAAPQPEVVTVHDVPPLRFADEGVLTKAAADSARRARRVIVPSRFAADEVKELLGVQDSVVIPYGVSDDYSGASALSDGELKNLGVHPTFIIHAAGASARKNLAGLAQAWRVVAAAESEVQLVLCGPTDVRRDTIFAGLPRVLKTGRLESRVVAGLMRRASAVVVPSTYEGFGLPALEGMVCGVPVVAARCGALPEVCGDAAVLTEPDGEALADGLVAVLRDGDLAKRLRSAGLSRATQFRWDRAARDHVKVYEEVLAG